MTVHPLLQSRLAPLLRRRRRFQLLCQLAGCWAVGALVGVTLLGLQQWAGWSSSLALPLAAVVALALAAVVVARFRQDKPDWRALALQLEAAHPELNGVLITAVQQSTERPDELSYLQQRVLEQAVAHSARSEWTDGVPASHLAFAHGAQLATLAVLAWTLWELKVPVTSWVFTPTAELAVNVTPGDVEVERGTSLVVAARFRGQLPAGVDLVVSGAASTNRIALSKSLGDPLFGATVPEVSAPLDYHLEYAGKRTRAYHVRVFEYPRLERADADISFPEYTRLGPKRVENTRRVSAVEGSRVSLQLQFNKPVAKAVLVSKGTNRVMIPLVAEPKLPAAALTNMALAASATYELQLLDAEGRTNRISAQFVFDAQKNRAPELKVSSPRGDTRPSALEEMMFEGTVYDDFGVQAFGIASTVAGKDPQMIELGRNVPGREKRPFQYLLKLEDLGLQPDDLLSWFVWAEDIGPDGKPRRTAGDLFFAEVRPFDEIFREGQSGGGEGQQQEQSGQQGSPATKLAELQKQIISATWKLFRQNGQPLPKSGTAKEPANDRSSAVGSSSRRTLISAVGGDPKTTQLTEEVHGPVIPPIRPSRSLFAQAAPGESPLPPAPRRTPRRPERQPELADDMNVVRSAQEQAREQAEAASQEQQNARNSALWEAVTQQMDRALEQLRAATNSPEAFQAALAAEQAAYRALLKLQEREFSVSRSRRQQGSQSGRQQQLQRQLDQLDLTQAENRYETERQARAAQPAERNEQLQVMNRLQELAKRQQDLNARLQELQSALQEAKTEKEKEELRRQLKRLQEEEQQLLADADEVRQRMDRPENQSQMAEQRQQMEQARENLQKAAEAAQQGQASQALASGTRAERQLQDMREQMRRQNAGEFQEELRQMRADARELARQQEQLQKKIETLNNPQNRNLSDTDVRKQALEDIARQRERLTNLVASATELSRQTEEPEPLVSRELYDTVRRFAQNETSTSKQFQEELINRRWRESDLYERLKRTTEESNSKTLDITSEMLRRGLLSDAGVAEERARTGINDLKRGVERAAQNVIGDDTESLRRAGEELNRMADQLQREIAAGENGGTNSPQELAQARPNSQPGSQDRQAGRQQGQQQAQSGATGERQDRREGQRGSEGSQEQREQQQAQAQGQTDSQGEQAQSGQQSGQNSQAQSQGQAGQAQAGRGQGGTNDPSQRAQGGQQGQNDREANNTPRGGDRARGGRNAGGNRLGFDFDRLMDGRGGTDTGPITGEDFASWSDGLREVEELVDTPSLRTDVARARERARQMRQDFTRNRKKPDWAVVRLQVLKPLLEVRNEITEELSRREPQEKLVPIDRDPVPGRYSELVRRYYEELGKGNAPANSSTGTKP